MSSFFFCRYHRITCADKKEFDFDPCLMEIFIVGYVMDIRRRMGKGEWVFAKLNGTKPPSKKQMVDNYGLFAQKDSIKLMVDFESYVKNCLTTHSSLLDAVQTALLIKPRPVKMAKKIKKDNVFTASNGMEFELSDGLLTRFLDENPESFKDYTGLFKISTNGSLSSEEPQVVKLVDECAPVYEKMLEEEQAEKAQKREENKRKRKLAKSDSSKNKRQRTEDHPYSDDQASQNQASPNRRNANARNGGLVDDEAAEDNNAAE